jgi:hypothetical protein
MKKFTFLTLLLLMSCSDAVQLPSPAPERPMNEVPVQHTLPDGGRGYSFTNGCVIELEPDRAVVRTESDVCALYQRDIALLYASGD